MIEKMLRLSISPVGAALPAEGVLVRIKDAEGNLIHTPL